MEHVVFDYFISMIQQVAWKKGMIDHGVEQHMRCDFIYGAVAAVEHLVSISK